MFYSFARPRGHLRSCVHRCHRDVGSMLGPVYRLWNTYRPPITMRSTPSCSTTFALPFYGAGSHALLTGNNQERVGTCLCKMRSGRLSRISGWTCSSATSNIIEICLDWSAGEEEFFEHVSCDQANRFLLNIVIRLLLWLYSRTSRICCRVELASATLWSLVLE